MDGTERLNLYEYVKFACDKCREYGVEPNLLIFNQNKYGAPLSEDCDFSSFGMEVEFQNLQDNCEFIVTCRENIQNG